VAARFEHGVDLVVSGEKSLRLAWGLEPPHDLFSSSCWPVRALDPVVQALVGPVVCARRQIPDRLDVTVQFVRDHDPRQAEPAHQFVHETSCRFGVPARLDEDIKHVAVGILIQSRIASRETITPRSAKRSSTSAVLSANR